MPPPGVANVLIMCCQCAPRHHEPQHPNEMPPQRAIEMTKAEGGRILLQKGKNSGKFLQYSLNLQSIFLYLYCIKCFCVYTVWNVSVFILHKLNLQCACTRGLTCENLYQATLSYCRLRCARLKNPDNTSGKSMTLVKIMFMYILCMYLYTCI
jgi:hypothetical protein